jgi:hypothetical protein
VELRLHLGELPSAFHHMVEAQVLITSVSSFSASAAFLSRGTVYHTSPTGEATLSRGGVRSEVPMLPCLDQRQGARQVATLVEEPRNESRSEGCIFPTETTGAQTDEHRADSDPRAVNFSRFVTANHKTGTLLAHCIARTLSALGIPLLVSSKHVSGGFGNGTYLNLVRDPFVLIDSGAPHLSPHPCYTSPHRITPQLRVGVPRTRPGGLDSRAVGCGQRTSTRAR